MLRKKRPLAGVLSVILTNIWKGGSHESSTRSTVQSAEVPGGDNDRGDRRAVWLARQTSGCGATARDDADHAGPGAEHLSGPLVCGRRTAAQRRVHRGALHQERG